MRIGEFWQNCRPNGYLLDKDSEGMSIFIRNEEIHLQDKYIPQHDAFNDAVKCELDDDSILAFVNEFGLLFNDNVNGKSVDKHKASFAFIQQLFNLYDQNDPEWYKQKYNKNTKYFQRIDLSSVPATKLMHDIIVQYWNDNISKYIRVQSRNDQGNVVTEIISSNLISHMWLNIFNYLQNDRLYARCEYINCKKFFHIDRIKKGPKPCYCCQSHNVMQSKLNNSD